MLCFFWVEVSIITSEFGLDAAAQPRNPSGIKVTAINRRAKRGFTKHLSWTDWVKFQHHTFGAPITSLPMVMNWQRHFSPAPRSGLHQRFPPL